MNFKLLPCTLLALLGAIGCDGKSAVPVVSAKSNTFTREKAAPAAVLHLRLVNARSGEPIGQQALDLSWGDTLPRTTALISQTGSANVPVPPGASTVLVEEGPRVGTEPRTIALMDCNSALAVTDSVQEVLAHGLQAGDSCNPDLHITPKPGEIIFYALPLPSWMPAPH